MASAAAVVCLVALAWPAVAAAQEAAGPSDGAPPLDLRTAIAEALSRSPALRPALDATELSAIRREVAASEFGLQVGPTFTAATDPLGATHRRFGVAASKRLPTGTALRVDGDWLRYGGETSSFQDGGLTLGLSQPLLRGLGPALTADLRNAERGVTGAERRLEEARQHLVLRVAGAYYGAVRQQRLVESGARAVDRAVTLRRASEARMSVGLATRLDVLRADLLVSESQANLDRQRELLAENLDELKVLLGRPLDAAIALAAHEIPLPDTPAAAGAAGAAADLSSLIESAIERRLDLREARDRVTDAERTASVARWNRLPQVDLNVSYTRRGLGTPNDVLQVLTGGWRFGVTTSYPLNRAADAAAVETAKIGIRGARRSLEDLEQQAIADVRRAWRARERAGAGIAIQEKAMALARQQLRLAEIRYQRGLAGNFDVIDAESNLFRAESALITAQIERALAELSLERAAGTLDPSRYLR